MSGERAEFLRELSAYYIQTRYPEEIRDLGSQAKKEEARRVLDHTEEVLQWLNSMLQSSKGPKWRWLLFRASAA